METTKWKEIQTGGGCTALHCAIADTDCEWLIVDEVDPVAPEQGQPCRLVLEFAGREVFCLPCPNPAAAANLAESIDVANKLELHLWN